ncbi:hypothetical protein NA57DRAFT_19857, partial [Rhizodiscina lignyota]
GIPTNLVGTWSSKSNQTFTGPGFYNPKKEQFIEPSHTGISYSFTADGHYETAYYRAIANPVNPACPGGIMQWQHGTYQVLANGSIVTAPFEVDGRQLLSQPCEGDNAIYTRYNQSELFQRFSVYTDPYHNILRLDLFRFDGSPVMPLYIAYNPPQMLPTSTLNPTSTSSGSQPSSTSSSKFRMKRSLDEWSAAFNKPAMQAKQPGWINPNMLWWFGVGATGVGSVMYFCF